MDFENLLAQLMMASGLQNKQEADQKHAILQQTLARKPMDLELGPIQMHDQPAAKPKMDLELGPVQMHPQTLEIGEPVIHDKNATLGPRGRGHTHTAGFSGMSERDAYAQLDARAGQPTWTLESAGPEDRARLDQNRREHGMGPLQLDPRGNPLPQPAFGQRVTAGAMANTAQVQDVVAPDLVSSADERNYRARFGKPAIFEPAQDVHPSHGFTPSPYLNINEPLDLVSDQSLQRDDDVSQTGWLPEDFKGMSGQAAAALIADQLRTRRIRQLGYASPDYLETLPKY